MKTGIFTSRVESDGRLLRLSALPLVEPDVRISRIRLSCKHFIMGESVPTFQDTGSDSCPWDKSICVDCAGSGV